MAEWLKATVLKTVEPQGSVGSNPTPSATASAAEGGGSHGSPDPGEVREWLNRAAC